MKKEFGLLIVIASLLISAFEPLASSGPTQPPVDTTTLYVGTTGWGPRRADPVRAYDTGSEQLIFNVYDTLIGSGAPVTHEKTWDVQEQYWDFEPRLATNVPTRQEVNEYFTEISLNWQIVIWNEEPINGPYPIPVPILSQTWWEDDTIILPPRYAYHITNWIDATPDGILSPGDLVQTVVYLWAPVLPEKVTLVQSYWWQVLQVDQLLPAPPPLPPQSVRLHLGLISDPGVVSPAGTWLSNVAYPDKIYQIVDYVDENLDGQIGSYDVLHIKEYNVVPVPWDKIGQGIILVPDTCLAWQVVNVALPTLQLRRYYYDFNIRTDDGQGGVINFVNETGAAVDTFDIYDAEYSFKKGLVQDQDGGPMWMFYKMFFAHVDASDWNSSGFTVPDDYIRLSYSIKDVVEVVSVYPPVLRINVGPAFPDVAFKETLAQTWSSIVSKEFSTSIGCWDGDLFKDANQDSIPDWYKTWTKVNRSPYDKVGMYRYVGTGPYRVAVFNQAANLVVMQRNTLYWKGWPAPDRKAFLEHIQIEYIADWASRRDRFIASQLDVCYVPRDFMGELLDVYGEPRYPEIKTIKKVSPVLSLNARHFTFTIDAASPYIGTGSFPNGIPTNFFNNTHVRKAFGYSLNRTQYVTNVFPFDEPICRETPLIYGLFPDYYTRAPDPPWTYDIDYDKAKAELQAALFPSGSVWQQGFNLTLATNGGISDLIALYMIRDFFTKLSTYGGRIDPPFTVNVVTIDWPTYLDDFETFKLPVWMIGWIADFADASNFEEPYMASNGDFAYYQNYTITNGWSGTKGTNFPDKNKDELIKMALRTPDSDPARGKMYADLDTIYIQDCPSLPSYQVTNRYWCKYWVKGWYYNALYPSDYYYKMYKEDTCWCDVTGPTVGTPDGTCNMRDIGYIAGHFGAVAPDTSKTTPYDPLWAPGIYGYGGNDVYGDRKVDMRDVGVVCAHFGHRNTP